MRSTGLMEIARRLVPLVLLLAAIAHVASAPDGTRPWLAWGLIAGAVAVYLLLPFEQPPEGALRHSRLAAVLLPDLIGFTLSLTFFGIYIVLVADNPNLWGVILLLGPPGAICLAILLVAAWYASFWMVIEADRLSVATLRTRQELPFAAIRSVKPTRHLLPHWLAPLLVLAGGWRGLGVALLHGHRASHGLRFDLADGSHFDAPVDAFPEVGRLLSALKKAGVRVDVELDVNMGLGRKPVRKAR